MSSSDAFLRRFAWSFGLLALAALSAGWLLDPTGLLALGGAGAGLCAPGSRGGDERFVKMLIPRIMQPEEILAGSSRSIWMFRDGVLAGRAANLSLSSASIAEIDMLVRRAIADAPVRRVWIGLDFGAFALPDSRPAALQQPWSVADRRATAWRYGLIHPRAMRATLLALADPGGCAAPPFSAAGFARRGLTPGEAAAHDLHPDVGAQARTRASWQAEAAQRERFSAGRFALLDALLGELKRRRIAVVLFLTPSPSSYRTLVAEAGLAGDYERWRRRAFAYDDRAGGIVVVPADSPEFLRSVAQARCAGADPDACLFYDRAHARPVLGAAIVRAAGARP